MDDPKRPFGFQENQEEIKTRSLKVKLKSSKSIHGWYKEESHLLQEKDQNSELKSDHKNVENHLQSSSVDQENRKGTQTATEESVHGGNLKINSEKITCPVYGKNFLSMKSICGHMRLHPEREWRGIEPPPTLDSSMVKIEDTQQNSLKVWSKTEKRGRIRDELDVASALLELLIGNSLDLAKKNKKRRVTEGTLMVGIADSVQVLEGSDLPKKLRNEKSELGNSEFQCKKPNIHQENENSRAGFNPELVKMDLGLEISNGFEEFSGKNSRADQQVDKYRLYSSISRNSTSLKSKNLMKKFCELDEMNYNQTPISSNRFECITCNKSFPSYQALGGHKSSQRNYKNSNNHKADVEEFSLANADRKLTQVDELQDFKSIMTKNVETHRCKICYRTFLTGQALGGHQTLHRPGPTRAPTSSVSPSEIINKESPMSTFSQPEIISKDSSISSVTLVEGASNMMERKLIDIDLNELPRHDECLERKLA